MDTWEKLKIGLAGAGVVVALVAIHEITDYAFAEPPSAKFGYKVADVTELPVNLATLQRSWPAGLGEQGGRGSVLGFMSNIEKVSVPRSAEVTPLVAPEPPADLGTLLAAADPKKGQQTAMVCASCHTFDSGGPDHTGPNLYGLVGRNIASHGSFAYSSAFKAQTGPWTYDRLDHYLSSPQKAVPGNKMAFNGIRRAEDRANVIAYLSTLSAAPAPFPKPEKPKVAEAAPGSGQKAVATKPQS